MNANPAEFIVGAAQVVDYYGYWATFHDAILIDLQIAPEEESITAVFIYDDMTNDENRSGSSRITLQWRGVLSYTLQADYTRYQMDSLYHINFVDAAEWVDTELVPVDGAHGKIRSRSVQVTQFQPLP